MSFDLKKELEKLNSTAPVLRDPDEAYSGDGRSIVDTCVYSERCKAIIIQQQQKKKQERK